MVSVDAAPPSLALAGREDVAVVTDICRFDARAAAVEVAAALRSDGAAIIERLAPEELCDRFDTELAPHLASRRLGRNEFEGTRTRRPGSLPTRVPSSVELIANDLILEVIDAVRSPPTSAPRSRYQLHLAQAICIGPGETAQMLHRDQWSLDSLALPDELEVELSTIWALTEFTETNGATRVALGTDAVADADVHRLNAEHTVAAAMPRGSVVLYTPRTVHGGGANASAANRIGVNVDYVRLAHRQDECRSEHPDVDVALTERLHRLMVHPMAKYAIGYWEDTRRCASVQQPEVPRSAHSGYDS